MQALEESADSHPFASRVLTGYKQIPSAILYMDDQLEDIPYISVYNAMFFLSYSCHKKAPRIIHRCRI